MTATGEGDSVFSECGLSQVGLAPVDGPISACTQAILVLKGYLKKEGRKDIKFEGLCQGGDSRGGGGRNGGGEYDEYTFCVGMTFSKNKSVILK